MAPAPPTPRSFLEATLENSLLHFSAIPYRGSRSQSDEIPAIALRAATASAKPTSTPLHPFGLILDLYRGSKPARPSSETASSHPDSACTARPLSCAPSCSHR